MGGWVCVDVCFRLCLSGAVCGLVVSSSDTGTAPMGGAVLALTMVAGLILGGSILGGFFHGLYWRLY